MKRWIQFSKYQGTGNDFVLIDNRLNHFPKDNQLLVARLCDRKFGVGADGLILIENHDTEDFSMVYYNADGAESTMCGNGGRCLVAFAKQLNIINHSGSFMAVDGVHHAVIDADQVKLQMKDVSEVQVVHGDYFLDTGSPHHVALVDAVLDVNVPEVGASIRYGQYGAQGVNRNVVTPNKDGSFLVRTYERGVEDETLSGGTGVTAVAIAMHYAHKTEQTAINVQTPGGDLQVSFEQSALGYEKIFLTGGAVHVFDGSIWIDD